MKNCRRKLGTTIRLIIVGSSVFVFVFVIGEVAQKFSRVATTKSPATICYALI